MAAASHFIDGKRLKSESGEPSRSLRATAEIRSGCVWVNDHIAISEMPHGGYKQSGSGKDMSQYSFDEYTNIKHVMYDRTAAVRKDWHRTVFGAR